MNYNSIKLMYLTHDEWKCGGGYLKRIDNREIIYTGETLTAGLEKLYKELEKENKQRKK